MPHENGMATTAPPAPGAQEAESDDNGIVRNALKNVLGAAMAVPGVDPALKALNWWSESTAGYARSKIFTGYTIAKEQGLGTALKESLIEAVPFSTSETFSGTNRTLMGYKETDNFRERLSKVRDWQRESKSLFWGEKLISDIVFDPVTFFPIGKAVKLGARTLPGARKTAREAAEKVAISEPGVALSAEVKELGQTMAKEAAPIVPDPQRLPLTLSQRIRGEQKNLATPPGTPQRKGLLVPKTSDEVNNEAFKLNALRKLTLTVYKSPIGKIPGIRSLPRLIGPSGLIDPRLGVKPKMVQQAVFDPRLHEEAIQNSMKREFIVWLRTLENFEQTINHAMFSLKAIGKTPWKMLDNYKNPYVRAENAADLGGGLVDVPIHRIFENPELFKLSTKQDEYVKQTLVILDAAKVWMKREGIPVPEIDQTLKNFFPRMVDLINEVEVARRGGKGGIGAVPGSFKERMWDPIEESIRNGTVYAGAKSSDPVADMLNSYLNGLGKAAADHRLGEALSPLGTTITQRVALFKPSAASAWGPMKDKGYKTGAQVMTAIVRQQATLDNIKRRSNDLSGFIGRRPKAITTGSIGAMDKIDPTGMLGMALTAAKSIPKQADRNIALNAIKQTVDNLAELQNITLNEIKSLKASIKRYVANPKGLAPIQEPAFSGKLFSKVGVEAVAPFMNVSEGAAGIALGKAATISSLMRAGALTFDFGAGLLQGAMVLTSSPMAWGKAFGRSLYAFADPTTRFRYMESKAHVHEIIPVHVGSTEMTEAFLPGGIIDTGLRSVKLKPVLGIAQRFAGSFETFFDVARTEMAEAWLPAVRRGAVTGDDVALNLNKITGITSSRALGVSATQREVEGVAFSLAPNWFRATTALLADAFQGGYSGHQARLNISRFFAGTAAAYAGVATALDQPIRLDPRPSSAGGDGARFMTVEIGGQIIGLGGKPYSMARTLVKMATDPDDAMLYAKNFFRGQAAPITGSVWDIATGETYLGEPVEGWQAIATQGIGSKFLPFWLESQINDSPKPSGLGFAADVVGARSWPLTPKDALDEVRDELAALIPTDETWLSVGQRAYMDKEGLSEPTWEMLDTTQKHRITRDKETPENADARVTKVLQEHWAKYDGIVRERNAKKPRLRAVTAFQEDREDTKTQWEESARLLQSSVDALASSPRDFLQDIRPLNIKYGASMERIHKKDGMHEDAHLQFKKWAADGKDDFIPEADLARDDYINTIIGGDFTNEWGIFDFDRRDVAEAKLRARWPGTIGGDNIIDRVEADFKNGRDMPPLWKRWMYDREILRGYWKLHIEYLWEHPEVQEHGMLLDRAVNSRNHDEEKRLKKDPMYTKMERDLSREKRALRMEDPFMDATLYYWGYVSTLLTDEAHDINTRGY